MIELTLSLLRNVSFVAFIALVYGLIVANVRGWVANVILGLLMGAGAILSMMEPSEILPGVIVDSRSTLVMLSSFFAGPIGGSITWLAATLYRISIGGQGVPAGVVGIFASAVIGLAGYYLVKARGRRPRSSDILILAAISPFLSLTIFLLPFDIAVSLIKSVLPLAFVRIIGILALGLLILHEVRRVAAETEVRRLAFVDELSGLSNRRAFYSHLEQAWRRWERYRNPFSIIIIDIDYFKLINDRYGHPAGDEVIRRLADIMRSEARGSDIPARIGGEEFVILLPNTDTKSSEIAANRIRLRVEEEVVEVEGDIIRFTISIGISNDAARDLTVQAMLSSADQALYEAKRGGRNRVCVAGPPQDRAPVPGEFGAMGFAG
ncbi:diguanylate cyclase [Acuticoccus kandeliae]|uniref:diguanylate cyclase n=1 Tax=Acuticoccus kandeliae TaxID=2073160 RepID=UPI000D3ED39A|nr:diguanylate cyclase [Acuticoccus kandeliae]